MGLKALERALRSRAEWLASGHPLQFENICLGRVERLTLSRETQGVTRYLQVTPVEDLGGPWEFAVLLGAFGNTDRSLDSDGRRGGSQQYVENLVQRWLLECCSWEDLDS